MRPEALGNRCPLDLGLIGDVRETLQSLLPSIPEKVDTSHLDAALAHYKKAREGLDKLAEPKEGSKLIHPQYVTRLVSELAAEDAIFTCDVGTPILWTARYLKVNGKRRIVGSFNHGSMANAMLHAMGAQVAFPDRQVISMSGDGGFSMMMGDFLSLTAVETPGQDHSPQQRNLGFRRDGDEGEWLRRCRMRPDQPQLRGHGQRRRRQGHPRGGSRKICARR